MRERLEVIVLTVCVVAAMAFRWHGVAMLMIGALAGVAYFHAEQADERASKDTE